MGKTKVVLQKSPLNTRSFQGRTGGMKAASPVTWGGVVPLPVMPHSLLWGALLLVKRDFHPAGLAGK